MPKTTLPREEVLSLLARAPERVAELTSGLEPATLRARPSQDEWSVNDVLAHLRSCADVWGDCIRRILVEDRPTIRAIDPRTWTRQTDYPDLEFRPSLDAFTAQRAELLAVFESLSPEDWPRTAIMTGAGKPIERTVHSFAVRLVIHERPHVKQIQRIVNAMRT